MKFCVVTWTSLYEIRDGKGLPVVEKIQLRKGTSSKVRVGERLCDGDIVYLSRYGIYTIENKNLVRDKSGEIESGFGGHTSPVVGLFLSKKEAVECLDSGDRTVCDRRWKKQTLEVLAQIGGENPVFIIAKNKYNSFKY